MQLLELLKQLDTRFFLSVNGLHTSFFDGFMYAMSVKLTWIPLYLAVLFVLIKKWNKEAIWLILCLVLCIVISDQVASGLLKHLFKRLRPSHVDDLKNVIHLVKGYTGGLYGFASSHASNAFGFALLSSLIFKQRNYTFAIFFWAILTAYSRIYLGVHYPFDIVGGVIVGTLAALGCYWITRKYKPSLFQQDPSKVDEKTTLIPVVVLGLSFLCIIVYSLIA